MPALDHTDHCKAPTCRASILWVKSVNDKDMCLDYLPHVEGNIEVTLDEDRGVRVGRVLTGFGLLTVERPGTLYRHHRASCADPEFFTRKAEGSRGRRAG